ncbi:unnamed protein product [Sympodiomycopsis kandeliae]
MSAYLTSSSSQNLSLWSFPAVLLLAAIPHWWSIQQCLSKKINGGWKNDNPRGFVAQLHYKQASGKKLSELEKMIIRAQAAQQNGFEWFGFWAACVLAGNLAKLPSDELNRMSALYVGSRVLYNFAYVYLEGFAPSLIRTAIFQVGVIAGLRLVYLASKVLA